MIFDGKPLDTPIWSNRLDNTPPVSKVSQLSTTQAATTFQVQWSGTDVGSGIQDYTVSVSDNNGPFTSWQTNAAAASATFTGQVGHTYSFYSIARDLVGNVETAKTGAEATTTVTGQPSCAFDATPQFKITRSGFRFNNATQRFVQTITLQQLTLTPIQLPLSLVLDNLSPNTTLFNKTGVTGCAAPAGSPYINVTGTSAVLEFTNPTNAGITYNTRVLEGTDSR